MKKVILFCILFLCACNVCNAQSELDEKSRKAKQSDMIGTWTMTYQTVSPLFRDNSLFFANYQIFQFSEDGYVKNIASNKRQETGKINFLLQKIPQGSIYSFVGEGRVIIKRSKKDVDNILVSIAVDDFKKILRSRAPLLNKGEIIVSYLDPKDNLYMQRYLSRIDLELK